MSSAGQASSSFAYTVKTAKAINAAVEDIVSSLKEVGFGVIATLDFREILKKKGIELGDDYRLLEVCNPASAKKAIESNPEIGLLLPCTIAVYRRDDSNYVSLARPTSLLANLPDRSLDQFGEDIEQKLVRAIQKAK